MSLWKAGAVTAVPVNLPEAIENPLPAAIPTLLDRIEASALEIYALHGLPTAAGEYARRPRGKTWTFLGDRLTAEQKWDLVLAGQSARGWRFSALEDLGAHEGRSVELTMASQMLQTSKALRTAIRERAVVDLNDSILAALQLGAEWKMLDLLAERRQTSPLKLSAGSRPRQSKRRD